MVSVFCFAWTSSPTTTNLEPDRYNEEWADNSLNLMGGSIKSILHRLYYQNMNKYIAEKPVTEHSFLNYLLATTSTPATCGIYEKTKDTFESVRKLNPIECDTGRVFNRTQDIESLNDFINALAPYGPYANKTKRTTKRKGNCVFVMFYTKYCISSNGVWAEFQVSSKFFPHMQFLMIDSLRFYTLNADFGITGLPTLMLFHQGKPARKYNLLRPTAMRIIKFIWQNTNLNPSEDIALSNEEEDYNMPARTYPEPDPYLSIAWSFIFICILYYFVQTAAFSKFVGFLKRMWHESHEHNE